jgi:hypothetical protein
VPAVNCPSLPETYGDLDADGIITGGDLGILLTRWGPVP